MTTLAFVTALLASGVRHGTPVALAASGEALAERSGVLNVGLEGTLLLSALAAYLTALATGSAALGVAAGALAGAFLGLVFAALVVGLRVDQVVAGVALNLLAFGVAGVAYRGVHGETGEAVLVPPLGTVPIPGLASIPVLGPALFDHEPLAYAALAVGILTALWLRATAGGLELRACGASPLAADVAGVPVARVRARAVVIGGLLAGLGGADLALAQARTFTEAMVGGRGFLALAVVILGRRGPLGAVLAALLFGVAEALEPALKARGTGVPRELLLALPYALTLAALALAGGGRVEEPASLGRAYARGEA